MAAQVEDKNKRPAADNPEMVLKSTNTHITVGIPLDELGLSTRVVALLGDAGLETAQDILEILGQDEAENLGIPGIGPKYTMEVRQQLIAKGLLEAEATKLEREHQSRIRAEKKLSKALEDLADAKAELKQQKMVRFKAEDALVAAEKALAETKKTPLTMLTNKESSFAASDEEGAEKRHSFILRVTTDEQGQPRRTEVEHVKSCKKKRFTSLDMQQLVTFIEEIIRHRDIQETSPPPAVSPARNETPTPQLATRLGISTVNVLRPGAPGGMDLILNSGEYFMVEAQFHLEGADAIPLTTQESAFQVKVYAHNVTSGTATMLTTYTDNLAKDVLSYKAQMSVSGMAPGLYRLFILVVLQAPSRMISHYDGPTFQIIESLPLVSPTIQSEAIPA